MKVSAKVKPQPAKVAVANNGKKISKEESSSDESSSDSEEEVNIQQTTVPSVSLIWHSP